MLRLAKVAIKYCGRFDHAIFRCSFRIAAISATVLVGDRLAMKSQEEWHMLAHIMGGWNARHLSTEREGKGQFRCHAPSIRTLTHPEACSRLAKRRHLIRFATCFSF